MANFWDERYAAEEYVYGKAPNVFFKSILDTLPAGKLLVPGAGEGRDAVYAAQLGWQVNAFDASVQGRLKALGLASLQNVQIDFEVLDAANFNPVPSSYDAVALIYFHLPPALRANLHAKIITSLKPGGLVILEAFNPKQLNNQSGGPKELAMLMTLESLQSEFSPLEILQNTEIETILEEGSFHSGQANVVRFIGRKPLQ